MPSSTFSSSASPSMEMSSVSSSCTIGDDDATLLSALAPRSASFSALDAVDARSRSSSRTHIGLMDAIFSGGCRLSTSLPCVVLMASMLKYLSISSSVSDDLGISADASVLRDASISDGRLD
eukprot:scaffold433_cov257-Pinguiococcus_pyrenoidosus.AAC.33